MTVINRQYNYIFVHIPKAAGKSVKEHLLQTTFGYSERKKLELGYALEALGSYMHGHALARHFVPWPLNWGIDTRLRAYCRDRGLFTSAHLRAQQLGEALGADTYAQMYSFAFVRNPWDRCLSAYHYFRRKTLHPLHTLAMTSSFEEFLLQLEGQGMPFIGQQSLWLYSDAGERMVDFIGKVESIEADMAQVGGELGIAARAFSAHVNRSAARDADYRPYYTTAAREIVSRAMAPDIARLGYTF